MSEPRHVLTFGAGCHVSAAAQQLVEAAKVHGYAEGSFNGIELTAHADTRPESIVVAYKYMNRERAEQYRNSPEGKLAAAESERIRADLQAKHDVLMRKLMRLNFNDWPAVIDWLCEMQPATDHVGVIVRRKTILAEFAKHEFLPGVNCGADFRPEVASNVHRWLVGQALSGLEEGAAIHGIVHKFAAEWKAKFLRTPQAAQ